MGEERKEGKKKDDLKWRNGKNMKDQEQRFLVEQMEREYERQREEEQFLKQNDMKGKK